MNYFAIVWLFCAVLMLETQVASAQSTSNQGPAAQDTINTLRTQRGRAAIHVNKALTDLAAAHAKDMAKNDFFSHKGSNGSLPHQRAKRAGYRYCTFAENISKGNPSVSNALERWMASGPHRKNLLNARVTEFGLVRSGDVYVLVLGQPGC